MSATVEHLSDSVTIMHGDCLAVDPIAAEAVVSDPPYGMGWRTNYSRLKGGRAHHDWPAVEGDDAPFDPKPWLEYERCVLWGSNHYAARLPLGTWLFWLKRTDPALGTVLSDGELAWCKGGEGIYVHRQVWNGHHRDGEMGEPYLHATQKPVGLMAWCMERAKAPVGSTVLDPYMGSGTTGVAAIRTGRKFIGIEINAEYYATARKRLLDELAQGRLLLKGGT